MTSSDNNSLAGLSVKNIEVVNITNSDFLGAGQGELAAATATASAAAATYSAAQANEASIIKGLTAQAIAATFGPDELSVIALETASSAAQLEEYLAAINAVIGGVTEDETTQADLDAILELDADEFAAAYEDVIFSQAQLNQVVTQMQLGLDGVPVADDDAVADPEVTALTDAIVSVAIGYQNALSAVTVGERGETTTAGLHAAVTALEAADEDQISILKTMTPSTAGDIEAAYAAVDDLDPTVDGSFVALTAEPDAVYSKAQYNAALAAAKVGLDGEAITAQAGMATRAGALGTAAAAALDISIGVGDYSTANLNTAITLVTSDHDGKTILTADADDSDAIAARIAVVTATYTAAIDVEGVYNDGLAVPVTSYKPATITYADLTTVVSSLTRTDLDDGLSVLLELSDVEAGIADLVAAREVTTEAKVAKIAADTAVDQIDVTAASVAASGFVGAEQVWFKGTSGETAISAGATQIIGFSGVTAMDNAVTTAAVSPTFAISGSKGDLEVKGAAATSLNFIGTGGTVAPSLTTTKTNEILSVTSSTSGTLTLDLTALTDLETATANGTGALSLQNSPDTLATITTGAGADKMEVTTATEEDNEDTDEVETVSAVVSTGAGKDTIVVNTDGAGTTSIDAGEGDDTVVLVSKSDDTVSIDLGAGSDTFKIGALSNISTKTTVAGGDGVDTLITSENNFKASDYLLLKSYVSGFEKLVIVGEDAEIDASELTGFASIDFKNGDGTVTDVNGQTLILSSREEADKVDEIGLAAVAQSTGDDLVAVALGYDNEDADAIEFGGDLNVVVTGNSAAAAAGGAANVLALFGNNATVTAAVAPLGASVSVPVAVIGGDIVTLTANMSSLAFASKGTPINVSSILIVDVAEESLFNLETITVRGAGIVMIDADWGIGAENAVLTTIDVSAMTKQIQVDGDGDETGVNQSTTTIFGNPNAAEEILLGGAKDQILLDGSTAGAMDSVTGFTLVATKSDSEVANTVLSDEILHEGDTYAFDIDASYSSLTEAVLELAATAEDAHIFHADGNTYIFHDGGNNEYDDEDLLIELTGTYDLTLLANLINAEV